MRRLWFRIFGVWGMELRGCEGFCAELRGLRASVALGLRLRELRFLAQTPANSTQKQRYQDLVELQRIRLGLQGFEHSKTSGLGVESL